jgi:hypothetical protein
MPLLLPQTFGASAPTVVAHAPNILSQAPVGVGVGVDDMPKKKKSRN